MAKIMENPIKMDDLGGPPLFLETPTYIRIYIYNYLYTYICIYIYICIYAMDPMGLWVCK